MDKIEMNNKIEIMESSMSKLQEEVKKSKSEQITTENE